MCVRLWARVCDRLRVRAGACAREAVHVSVCVHVRVGAQAFAGVGQRTHRHTRALAHTRTHAHDGVANEGSTADITWKK